MAFGNYTKEELGIDLEFAVSPRLKHSAYRGWAIYYEKKQLLDYAIESNTDAYKINNDFIPVVYNKSRCLLKAGEPQKALEETEICLAQKRTCLKYNHQKIDCIFELNDIEEAFKKTYKVSWMNDNIFNDRACDKRLTFLRENLDQSVGYKSGPMLLKMRKTIAKILEERTKPIFKGPIWKYRLSHRECDVDSIAETNQKVNNPYHKYRRKVNLNIINHLYLDRTADDLLFIKQLEKNKLINLPQCSSSGKYILKLLKDTNFKAEKWRTMLKNRQPVYSKQYEMVKDEDKAKKYNQSILHRKQFQTRRDIFKQLQISRQLAAAGEADKLGKYASEVLGTYYTIHPIRVMPRKFEFTNELCNIVAIAYLSQIFVPRDIMICAEQDRIRYILGVPLEKPIEKFNENRKFGERQTTNFLTDKLADMQNIAMAYLEKSIALSSYPIESCLYSYEISKIYFAELRYDAIRFNAYHVIEKAKICKNYPWMYLGNYMLARADGAQNFYDNLKKNLETMEEIAEKLDDNIRHFNRTVTRLNLIKIEQNKKEMRRLKEIEEAEDARIKLSREMLLKR